MLKYEIEIKLFVLNLREKEVFMCYVWCVTILKYKYIDLCVEEVITIWINKIISYNT